MLTAPLTADERAFVVKNLPLVHHFARKYRSKTSPDYLELIAVGALGIAEGNRTYDENRGGSIGYWLSLYVRAAMIRWLRLNHSVVHRALNGKQGSRDASLDVPRYDDDPEGETWLDTIADFSPDPEAQVLATERETIVRQALDALGDDTCELLIARQVATLDEIGQIIGLSREGVRNRERNAMRRLTYAVADVR